MVRADSTKSAGYKSKIIRIMCGIAGVLSKFCKIGEDGNLATTEKMLDFLKHRGPDSTGLFFDRGVCVGAVRLSIVDDGLEAGQPLVSDCAGAMIVFNGEIYNHKELTTKLREKHVFKSYSDTETLVHLFEEYGLKCLEYLNGMFSFCVAQGDKIYLVRDRLGIKPLYYKYHNYKLFFASEAKALAKISTGLEINVGENFHDFETSTFPQTLFRNIYELPAGHYIEYDRKKGFYSIIKYYQLSSKKIFLSSEKENVEYFKFLLQDAVNLRIDTKKSYGCFVSGGIDSSVIAFLSHPKLLLSSVCFEKRPYLDERQYLNLLQKENKTQLIKVRLKPELFSENFVKMVYALDFPVGSLSAYPQYVLSKESAKIGLKIILTGLGVDEYLSGYVRHVALKENLDSILGNKNLRNYKHFFERLNKKEYKSKIELYANIIDRSNKHAERITKRISNYFENNDYLTAAALIDMNLSLPSLLRIDDRINMYHGIESRAPFLDYRLVEFCLSLSEEYKMRKIGGDIISKYILRQAYRDVVHPAILNCRIKIGFPSPVNLWLNGRYKYSVKRAYDVIKNIQKLGDLFDKSILKDYEPFSRKRWLLLQFAAWYLLFFENKTIEDVEEILFK